MGLTTLFSRPFSCHSIVEKYSSFAWTVMELREGI
jgi:hypothetical protein